MALLPPRGIARRARFPINRAIAAGVARGRGGMARVVQGGVQLVGVHRREHDGDGLAFRVDLFTPFLQQAADLGAHFGTSA